MMLTGILSRVCQFQTVEAKPYLRYSVAENLYVGWVHIAVEE